MKSPEFFNRPTKAGETFSFTADDVLKEGAANPVKLEYAGSAMSSFQQEPLTYGPDGEPIITSDWQMSIRRNLEGDVKGSHLVHPQSEADFPHFMEKKDEYFKRSQELGQNMFRFSLEFDRLCPKEGEFDEQMMGEYIKALALLKARGQEPMLAIYHWPMPTYTLETNQKGDITKGGWENPDIAKHFRFYVENVVKYLADDTKVSAALTDLGMTKDSQDKFVSEGLARYFLSINEPASILLPGYLAGVFPPFKKGRIDLLRTVTDRLVEAHDIAYDEIKEGLRVKNDPQVGVAHAWTYFEGALARLAQSGIPLLRDSRLPSLSNETLTAEFERDGNQTDFLGLQYYFRMMTSLPVSKEGRLFGEHPDFGDIYPPGIYENLKLMHNQYPKKEIFITEFGFAESSDIQKPYLLLETVRYIVEALKDGIPIKGMLLWSLVNNFEWAQGMDVKFGLFSEQELEEPLTPSKEGSIKGWEAWKAAVTALTNPTPEAIQKLERAYETAKSQFESSLRTPGA